MATFVRLAEIIFSFVIAGRIGGFGLLEEGSLESP
jgi:hypothetical protein